MNGSEFVYQYYADAYFNVKILVDYCILII